MIREPYDLPDLSKVLTDPQVRCTTTHNYFSRTADRGDREARSFFSNTMGGPDD